MPDALGLGLVLLLVVGWWLLGSLRAAPLLPPRGCSRHRARRRCWPSIRARPRRSHACPVAGASLKNQGSALARPRIAAYRLRRRRGRRSRSRRRRVARSSRI
jgi:hypothetical protein